MICYRGQPSPREMAFLGPGELAQAIRVMSSARQLVNRISMNIRSLWCLPLNGAPALCLVCISALAACSSHKPSLPNAPPEVGVVTLHPQPVTITTDLPG